MNQQGNKAGQQGELAIEAQGLVKIFGDNRAVDGVDLRVPTGTIYGCWGPTVREKRPRSVCWLHCLDRTAAQPEFSGMM